MRDKIIQQVVNKIQSRSDVGFKKYGVTLYDDDQPLDAWLNHIQEELMDAVNYIEKARMSLREEIEECYLQDVKNIEVTDPETISAYPEPDYGNMWTTNHT
ncbi:MAG: hypothetical protein CMM91_05440 [Rickettsiales bacterium]|nr:hypothetical protein [Rickettsiales bacterium]